VNVETFRDFCLGLPHCTESLPFDDVTLCFKIADLRIFAILPLDTPNSVNLKCDPEKAVELREQYNAVIPGFHSNKKHWNTVSFNDDLDDELLFKLVQHSYELVWEKIPKKIRVNL
jgi:predicted DNA-binding protein (MmcQ/YjbR family)